jgi:hypothetical protein
MTQITTAGRLLNQLYKESEQIRDAVAMAAGILPDRAQSAMTGQVKLTLSEQLRLSEAATIVAPQFSRQAMRLRGQALAARSYEEGNVLQHQDSPAERWERSAQLRR